MSRVAKKPVAIPSGVTASVEGRVVTTSAVRGEPVSAPISPKKSPVPIVDRPR